MFKRDPNDYARRRFDRRACYGPYRIDNYFPELYQSAAGWRRPGGWALVLDKDQATALVAVFYLLGVFGLNFSMKKEREFGGLASRTPTRISS
jgi:hypothetical protein